MLARRLAYSLAFLLLFSSAVAAQETERRDSLVRLLGCDELQQVEERGLNYRKALGAARFEHNSTLLLCDTALWNVNFNVINAFGNVRIIQNETVLESDRLDYFVDDNLARFRGTMVQLQDKDRNTLRTRNLDYNTRDSVATFFGGGAMRDKDGQVIESVTGTYDSKLKLFTFSQKVNMYTDSVFVKTDDLNFDTSTSVARFGTGTSAWKDGNMLSAQAGSYDRARETFLFTDKVHLLTKDQEAWSDSLRYHKLTNDIEMFGNVELLDTTRNVAAVAGFMSYLDSISQLRMFRDPAVIAISEQDGQRDTSYIGADTLIYRTFPKCDIAESVLEEAQTRLGNINVDPITEYRRKAAEQAKAAAAQAAAQLGESDPNAVGARDRGAAGTPMAGTPRVGAPGAGAGTPKAGASGPAVGGAGAARVVSTGAGTLPVGAARKRGPILPAPADDCPAPPPLEYSFYEYAPAQDGPLKAASVQVALTDTLSAPQDSLTARLDSIPPRLDSIPPLLDSLGNPVDSTALEADIVRDSTKVGFLIGKKNVKVFRSEMQVACDSLAYTDLDSLVRLYDKPVVWNEIRRQYSADSITVIVKNQTIERASLMSNAFIVVQEDSLSYDQIKGAEMMAYFDSTGALSRFDAMGGASGLFYIEENNSLATVNRFEAKMLTASFVKGNIQDLNYFDGVKSDAYPVVQLKKEEKTLKGYEWQPDRRPKSPEDITTLKPRKSERTHYESVPQPDFEQTDIYFPGYMESVHKLLAQQDSLKRVRQAERRRLKRLQEEEALRQADSLRLVADSLRLKATADSLALADSLAKAAVVPDAPPASQDDSLASDAQSPQQELAGQPKDSLSVGPVSKEVEKARRNIEKAKEKESRKLDRASRSALRDSAYVRKLREKEAKWAVQDSIDAEKAKVRSARLLEKKRQRTAETLKALEETEAKERRVLERYTARFEKRKARQDARKASQASKQSKSIKPTQPTRLTRPIRPIRPDKLETSKQEIPPKRQDEETGTPAKLDE